MNRKRKTVVISLLSVFTATTALAACNAARNINEVPSDEHYGYNNPDAVYAQPDEGFTIDGKADEEAYKNAGWVYLTNKNGNDTVDLAMTSYFGEKGMYFVYDVTESTPIYVNHNRASYINSGIEMYFAPKGVTSMSNDHIYEIDLEADGTLTFKKTSGVSGSWVDVRTTNDIMARLASRPKGGEINSGDCYGYTLEFFLPWDYVEYLGMDPETMKEEYVSVSPVHITSYNYAGTVYQTDRYWYPFASQLGGDGWGNVEQYFRFDKNGVVGTVPVTLGEGVHCTLSGPSAVIPGLPAKVIVTPEEGYAVSSLKFDGEERIRFVSYNEDGSATYTVTAKESGMTFSAEAEAVSAGNKNLTGKINLKKAGGDTLDGLLASYTDATGEHELPLTADGSFTLNDLAQGYYTIVAEKKGYGKVSRGIYLNRNIDLQIDLEFGMFDVIEGSCWDISAANEGYLIKKGGRGNILSKNSYETVYAEANFRFDESLAASSGNNDDKEQRAGIRMKFSGGKYWSVTVLRAGESYEIMYAQHNNRDFIFGWDSVHTMSAKEIAKYKSGEGIRLGILRVGTTAYLYLDGELVKTEDLGAQGIKADETVQIGFEGFYYNAEPQRIGFSIEEDDADKISLGECKLTGATAELDDTYKVGENVVLVLNKTNTSDVLLSLLINGEEMSGAVEGDGGTDILTLAGYAGRRIDVEAVYGTPREITANITVDGAWNVNGIRFTFINAADNTIVKTATVADNKMTIGNMLQGRWLVKADVFGKNIDLGSYCVVSEAEKQLSVENVFIGGNRLDSSVIDLSKGSFVYHSTIDEDYSIRIDEQGDAFLAAKISLGAADKAKLLSGGEVSFGMYMMVEDANGKATTHWTDFWIKKAGADDWLTIRTDFGWGEDFCKPFVAQVDSDKYSKALFGDGLYVVLRYKAETGVMETYFGENNFSVKYLRDWNDKNNLFPADGKVVQAGFRDNLTWGSTAVSVNVESFRYGKTLLEALGVAGKAVVLESEGAGGSVALDGAYKAGENVTLSVTPDEGKILRSLIVNGVDMTDLVATDGTLIIQSCTAAALDVVAEFIDIQYAQSFEVSINGRKYGVDGNAAEGRTVTLKRGDITVTGTVTGGKVTFEHVVIADRYTLTVEGFVPLADLTVTANGLEGIDGAITVEYDAFYAGSHSGSDWNGYYGIPSKVDKTHVNDAEPYFTVNGTDFYQYTNEKYGNVIASMTVKASMTDYNPTLGFVFEGHKAVMVRIERQDGGAKYKVQWIGDKNWEESSINGNWDFGNGEEFYNPISSALKQKYETEGLKLTLVRNGSAVCAYVDDVFVASQTIDGYADKTCSVFFAIAAVKGEQTIPFSISDTLPSVSIADQTAADAKGTVEVAQTAKLGETVTVRLTPIADYKVASLLVNGVDVTKDVKDNAYTFVAVGNAEIKATFEEIQKADITVSVTGKKLGVDGNAAEGLTATLSDGSHTYTGRVTNGAVAFDQVVTGGNYRLSIEGFFEKTGLTVTENGIEGTIALEYDLMEDLSLAWGWPDYVDLSAQNDGKITHANGATQWVSSKDSYDSVAITATLVSGGFRQGVFIRFKGNSYSEDKYVMIQKESNEKISWNGETNIWGNGSNLIGDVWTDYLNPLADGEYEVTLVRNANKIHVFVNGVYYDTKVLDESYADLKCYVGIYCTNAPVNSVRMFGISTSATITNGTTDENGSISLSKAQAKMGESVTVTITANQGYKLAALKVNGNDVTAQVNGGVYNLVVGADSVVVAEFTQIIPGSISAEIFGKKFGVNGNALTEGTAVTLKSAGLNDVTAAVTAEGRLSVASIPAGVWTVSIDGYSDVQITVSENTEYTAAITLEYDSFVKRLNWGSFDWTHANDATNPKIIASNGCQMVTTRETYGDVAFTLYLGGTDKDGGNQAIYFLFGNEFVSIRAENKQKIQFSWDPEWMVNANDKIGETYNAAVGSGWQDLIFFNNEQLNAFKAGTLKLTVVRRANTFYVYLDDAYIGQRTFDGKYADMQASVGICWSGLTDNVNRDWNIELMTDISVNVIDETTDTNGSASISSANPKVGDKVTITITPAQGYILKKLTVAGRDVTGEVKIDRDTLVATYEFTALVSAEVQAEFGQAVFGGIDANISGSGYGREEAIDLNGVTVTLSGKTEYSVTVTNGKITLSEVLVGEYTLKADGYVSQTIVVAEGGFTDAIVLAYNIFTSAPASADLSKVSEGKVTATGNGGVELTTKESYKDVVAEAHFDVPDYNSRRYSIALVFDDGKNFRIDFAVQDNGNNILQETNWSSMMFNWGWVDFPEGYFAAGTNSYSEAEIRGTFIANGLDFRLEREGATVKLYINGTLMKTYTLPDEYATKSAAVKFIQDSNGMDGTKGFTFDITVPESQG